MDNRLSLFLGRAVEFNDVKFYSPTINQIESVGEATYRIHHLFASFNSEKILSDLFGITSSEYEKLTFFSRFQILTENKVLVKYLSDALSFFARDNITFQADIRSFISNEKPFLSSDNYLEFVRLIHQINGVEEKESKPMKFKNEKTKQLFEKLSAMRNKARSKNDIDLKDMMSILCCFEGNGINIFNVGDLTIYQLYEQFERMSIKYRRETILPVWASGHLKEGEKLPELIIKTKF